MEAWIVSHYPTKKLERALERAGIATCRTQPDFVFTFGGDGTILEAERQFPGIPKIPLRESRLCSQCVPHKPQMIGMLAQKLRQGSYRVREWGKVEALVGRKKLVGLNEIQVRGKNPAKALRFSLSVEGKQQLKGDGIVAATAFGSTGYYRSLGGRPFIRGVRIGFNNVYPKRKPIQLDRPVRVVIKREDGLVIADNGNGWTVRPGNRVKIFQSRKKARFVVF